MIKATCIPCGAGLGSFRNREKYLEWRRQVESCQNCGAPLDTSLFTSYEKGELPAEEEAQPVAEETGEEKREGEEETPRDFFRRRRR